MLAALDFEPKPAAAVLSCTPSQLIRLLKLDPRALASVNRWRRDARCTLCGSENLPAYCTAPGSRKSSPPTAIRPVDDLQVPESNVALGHGIRRRCVRLGGVRLLLLPCGPKQFTVLLPNCAAAVSNSVKISAVDFPADARAAAIIVWHSLSSMNRAASNRRASSSGGTTKNPCGRHGSTDPAGRCDRTPRLRTPTAPAWRSGKR